MPHVKIAQNVFSSLKKTLRIYLIFCNFQPLKSGKQHSGPTSITPSAMAAVSNPGHPFCKQHNRPSFQSESANT
jgi:hypothetical protein